MHTDLSTEIRCIQSIFKYFTKMKRKVKLTSYLHTNGWKWLLEVQRWDRKPQTITQINLHKNINNDQINNKIPNVYNNLSERHFKVCVQKTDMLTISPINIEKNYIKASTSK